MAWSFFTLDNLLKYDKHNDPLKVGEAAFDLTF